MTTTTKTRLTSLCFGAAMFAPASAAVVLFDEDFETPEAGGNQPITTVGWVNDIANEQDDRIYEISADSHAAWSWDGSTSTEAFYTRVGDGAGYTSIDLANVTDLAFSVDNQSDFIGTGTDGHFALQLDNSDWFVSAAPVAGPTADWETRQMPFDSGAANWNTLTVSGTGATSSGAVIGGTAASDLTGTVTGVGYVVTRTGSATQNFDNFTVTAVPEPTAGLLGGIGMLGVALRRRRI